MKIIETLSKIKYLYLAIIISFYGCSSNDGMPSADEPASPNIVIIYTDDVGYGDLGSYGAENVQTPNIDKLADQGLIFTNAYATSATCTPSRYSLLTGEYPWRSIQLGRVARGDDGMLIKPGTTTVASILKESGYATAVIGKWHLGLGPEEGPDWNSEITPGPLDIGFDFAFLIPSTNDRVPTVFTENRRVVNHDPDDPIFVSFGEPIGDDPTGRDNPELLKMHPSHGHDGTIVNGISRIGYMTGGHNARWRDEDIADIITEKAVSFMEENVDNPFFLYFSTVDIHVPRVAHERFAGLSEMGPRGDVLIQLDWSVGEIMNNLEELELLDNTLVIFTSDNGPVLDDGYQDYAVEKAGGHKPAGPFRGGKYSIFEGGPRIPFIVYYPSVVKQGTSDALVSQVDLLHTMAALTGYELSEEDIRDGYNQLDTWLGKSGQGRDYVVAQNARRTLGLIKGDWKFIEPSQGPRMTGGSNIELGNDPDHQLYHLPSDPGEQNNLAQEHPDILQELSEFLEKLEAR